MEDTKTNGRFVESLLRKNSQINKDDYIARNKKNLAITCLDNLVKYQFTLDKKMIKFDTEKAFVDAIINELKIDGQILLSRTPFTNKVEIYK